MGTNIILGGTTGLGAEIAKALQAQGQETFVTGRTYEASEHGPGQLLDLNEMMEVHDFAREVGTMAVKGFWWVAATKIYSGQFSDQPPEWVEETVNVNLARSMMVAHASWRRMKELDQPAHFVVVSSTSGLKPRDNQAVYAATKWAQVGFTQSIGLDAEKNKLPMKVSLALPGGMDTGAWDLNPPDDLDTFMQPAAVAWRIVDTVLAQEKTFDTIDIPRGSV